MIKILYQIDILDFTLHLGVKKKEQCFASFDIHTNKIKFIHSRLVSWHEARCTSLKIDVNESRRKHTGLLALLEKPLSLINDDLNYQPINNQTAQMIKSQIEELPVISYSDKNPFDNVQIIIKNGKYYYCPVNNNR